MQRLLQLLLILFLCVPFQMAGQALFINEFVASNQTGLTDEDGDFEDWIEIYNADTQDVNLLGFALSDDEASPFKWVFPEINLPANQFLIVFASDKNRMGDELHSNFKIKASGETLFLTDPAGNTLDFLDAVSLEDDQSFGRQPDGSDQLYYFDDPTPKASNTTEGTPDQLPLPVFSIAPGFYQEEITLEISHESNVIIRYTIDGTEPTQDSPLYSSGILLNQREDENLISEIPTNPSFDFPKGEYTEVRANSRGWLPPAERVNKAHTIRVKAFDDERQSPTLTGSFFIDTNHSFNYTLPVISLVTDADNLFDDDIGIYVFGNHPEGNYKQKGSEWERKAHFEYFEEGKLSINQGITTRIHGGGSTHSAQKNIRLYADGDNGPENFSYPFFEDYELDLFRRLIIKGGGQRPDCLPRDQIAGQAVKHLGLSVQAHQEIILFINGEYWGLHGLKERYDDHYIHNKYHIDRDEVVILELNGKVDEGEEEDEAHYQNLLRLVDEEDITDPAVFTEIETLMDIDNYIDYQIAQIFMGNGDWPNGNIRFWRKRTSYTPEAPFGHDGRYRWMFYDIDNGFGGSCNTVTPLFNTMRHATSTEPSLAKYTLLFRSLLKNDEFKNQFINRFTDLLNTIYSQDRIDAIITEIESELSPEIFEHVKRWRYPSNATTLSDRAQEEPSLEKYNLLMTGLHDYAKNRPRKQKDHLIDYFQLQDSVVLQINVNDHNMGYVKVNSIYLNPDEEGVAEEVYPWNGYYLQDQSLQITAIPKPGHRFVSWSDIDSNQSNLEFQITSDSSFTAHFEEIEDFSFNQLVYINEVMADNGSTISDPTGAFPDWIELYNPTDEAINLNGYYLTDQIDLPTKYQFKPNGEESIIPANGYLIVWTDNHSWKGDRHTNFALSKSGEFIGLYAPDGVTLVDGFEFDEIAKDLSFGRSPDGSDYFVVFNETSPGSANPLVTDIEQAPKRKELRAYPNPSNTGLIFFNQTISGTIVDISGRPIDSIEGKNYWSYQKLGLTKGVYILKTQDFNSIKLILH